MAKRTLRFASAFLAATISAVLATQPASAESAGLKTSSVVVERDGASFRAVTHPPSDGKQKGTVIFLHGFPGGSVGTDGMVSRKPLVASLTAAGFGVVEINYVGTWSNAGEFSWLGGVKDAEAVVRYLRSAEAKGVGLDGKRIILVGHSYGGWVALTIAARDSALRCVAALASFDMGRTGQLMRDSSSFRDERIAIYEEVLNGSPPSVRASSAKGLADDTIAHADSWGLVKQVDLLRTKQLLLVAAENDTVAPRDSHFEPLVSALQRSSASSVRTFVIAGADHNFRGLRPEIDRVVLQWITEECRPA